MKEFFKITFASILGTLIALFVAFIVFFFFMSVLVTAFSTDEVVVVSKNSVLEIKLNYSVPERAKYRSTGSIRFLLPELAKELGVSDIVKNIKKAKKDDDIAGIFLNLNNFIGGSYASMHSIREELKGFRESGKFILAHGHRISQRAYYLASASDKIYLSKSGGLDARGMAFELMFFKKTMDKLEIKPQIFQSGEFKSAVETFERQKMSPENRLQLDEMLSSMYSKMIDEIADSRAIDPYHLKEIFDGYLSRDNSKLSELKLIDSIMYYDEVVEDMKRLAGVSATSSIRRVTLNQYDKVSTGSSNYSSNRIAVIYADGEIHEGRGDEESIGLENISKELRKARKDKNVKAIVLRVNSPGGSPLTSEQINREIILTRQEKPLVSSFGSVAASGGYYIACMSDEIVCDPYTITGSIGAYGIIPNFQDFMDNKLGITFDRVEKGKYSTMFSAMKPLSREEKMIIQNKVDEIYDLFSERVADGRNMAPDYVEDLAQGRVWSGIQAEENGLVDQLGGLQKAIEIAAEKAGLKDYMVVEYPSIREPFEKIMDMLSTRFFSPVFSLDDFDLESLIKNVKYFVLNEGIFTRMLFDIHIY